MPRPVYVFAGVAVALTLLLVVSEGFQQLDRVEIGLAVGLALLASAILRVSTYASVAVSGFDHGHWLSRVQGILAAGGIVKSDMYADAPFYLLELAIGQLVLGVDPFGTKFVTIAIGTMFPVVLAVFTREILGRQAALVAFLVAAPQMLFLRTSALLEAESLALPWAILCLYLLTRYLKTGDKRLLALLLVLVPLSVLLHFLYSAVIFGVAAGTIVLLYALRKVPGIPSPLDRRQLKPLLGILVFGGLFIPAWILTSQYAAVAMDTLRSIFDSSSTSSQTTTSQSQSQTTTSQSQTTTSQSQTTTSQSQSQTTTQSAGSQPAGESGGAESGSELIQTLLELFGSVIPEGDVVARSIGVGGSESAFSLLLAFSPLLIFLALSGIGGLLLLKRRKEFDVLLLSAIATIGGASVLAVFVGLRFNLGYRLYYFLAALLVPAAALALRNLTAQQRNTVLRGAVIACFLVFAFVGPMSPLGNNVDPHFGGNSWRLSETEYNQLQTLNDQLDTGEVIEHRVPQIPPNLRLRSINEHLYLTDRSCNSDSKVADTGVFEVCKSRS